jgi:transposase InsO family protein
MAWHQSEPMTERVKLITDYLSGNYGVSDLSRRYGVSRKTIYKWLGRHEEEGWRGLEDESRAPHQQANALKPEVEEAILALKVRWPDWGAPKLRHKLKGQLGEQRCPAESTVSAVLKRHGLVKAPRKRNRAVSGGTGPLDGCDGANQVWCVDFKGWWRTQDGKRCDPLTVCDGWSRYLLRCVGMGEGTGSELVRVHFDLLFREYGLPLAIRSDNGAPFASTGLGGLTKLSVWWLRLGLRLERITPGCPQENGRQERFHLTLQQSSARAPRENLGKQQAAFDELREVYNHERPHEALDLRVPGDLYVPSERTYNGHLPASREYPVDWTVRAVRGGGQMKWRSRDVSVSQALAGERIGFEPVADGVWKVWFEALELGGFDERKGRIERRKKLPTPSKAPTEQ